LSYANEICAKTLKVKKLQNFVVHDYGKTTRRSCVWGQRWPDGSKRVKFTPI